MMKRFNFKTAFSAVAILFFLSSCVANQVAGPEAMTAPDPIAGNQGQYMCPYTSDGVMAEWTDNAINASMGSTIGKVGGAIAGQQVLEQVPFVGGLLGGYVGEKVGRQVAISACGGWDFIKESSDLSFDDPSDMAVYLYVTHSSHEHYDAALNAAFEIYPELKDAYYPALVSASK